MNISDFLSPAQVMIDVRASDKSRLLEQLSTQAAADAGLPLDVVVLEIAKREKLGSTGVGNGVALPHARLPSSVLRKGLGEPFISAYLKLRHADWNEYAGQLTEWERRTTLDC